ncbi:hypothetical protein [Methylobacterium sp. R2-1]|uniref:hypothetical protein n=1 Tax=Methylobacterium sp. R2-1 TaxID=2587064 RepID=UPI00160F7CCF|nr:hypothetical protein [Methylobacterium sp. R2-1]MBB2963141.1 hypothetical protein [Methylobacterium sp. R2-1]
MAHIFMFPNASHGRPWPSRADKVSPARDSLGSLVDLLGALDALLESVRLAWWDGSALTLSRGGLESLVGLEPGDATPPRLVPAEARARVRAEVRA